MTNRSADIGASGVKSIMGGDQYRPYPAYKDSGVEWLGEIPAHWEVSATKRVYRIVNGATPKSAESRYWNGDIPWITPEDLGALDQGYILSSKRKITWEGYQDCGTTMVPVGSLVLSTRAPIGHLGIAGVKLCTNQGCRSLVFRYKRSEVYYFFQFSACRVDIEALGQGSTFSELSNDKLGDFEIAIPPLPEQRAIAAFLDRETAKIDPLVAKKERLIELLQEKRTALISHAVTKGLDPDVPLKDSGVEWLGEIPAHWEVKRLKHLLIEPLKYGANEPAVYTDHNLPRYIRITDIREDGTLRDDSFRSIPEEIAKPYLLVGGDILFARSGATVGKTFQYDPSWGKAAYAGYLIRARLNECAVESDFVEYFTQSQDYTNWLLSNFIQATIQNVSAERYATLSIPFPLLLEQRAIAAFLDHETAQIDALVAKVQEAIDHLKELRTALISATVTGKIDVREAAA